MWPFCKCAPDPLTACFAKQWYSFLHALLQPSSWPTGYRLGCAVLCCQHHVLTTVASACRRDDSWHHIAVTWNYEDGTTRLYFDGAAKTPFWKNDRGMVDDKAAREGGVDPRLGAMTERATDGSLVLGQVTKQWVWHVAQ